MPKSGSDGLLSPQSPLAEPAVARDRFATDHAPCLSCGYDLVGLPLSGACPECGTPVERSFQGDLLRFSSPDYLDRLHTGIVLAEIGSLLSILGPIGLVLLSLLLGVTTTGGGRSSMGVVQASISLVVSCITIVGWWLFTTPDPARSLHDTSVTARRIMRITLIIAALGAVGGFMVQSLRIGAYLGSPPAARTMGVLAAGVAVVSIAAMITRFFATMQYLRWIARRVPSKSLHDQAARFIWLGPVLFVCLCVVGWVASWIMYVVLLDCTRRELRETRKVAAFLGGSAAIPFGALGPVAERQTQRT